MSTTGERYSRGQSRHDDVLGGGERGGETEKEIALVGHFGRKVREYADQTNKKQ